MLKPEYWEDDEKWEYSTNLTSNSIKEEPLSSLKQAIAKARGDITCEQDMIDAINFCNQWAVVLKKQRSNPQEDE